MLTLEGAGPKFWLGSKTTILHAPGEPSEPQPRTIAEAILYIMRAHLTSLAVLLFAASVFSSVPASAAELASPPAAVFAPKPDWTLLREVLRASGVADGEPRRIYEVAFQTLLEDVSREVGPVRSSYRRARKLHDLLHQRVFRRYESTADGLDSILGRGEYNCLSASLLYGLLGRALGLEVQVVEIPRHVYVRFFIDQRRVEVESTARHGFDLRPRLSSAQGSLADPGYGSDADTAPRSPAAPVPESVDLERAVGFLWHNHGRRALERGDALGAAESFLEESKLEPLDASRSETLGMYLARAFRMDYEAGSFESAYRIAEIGMEIFPGQTTATDRFLAAALKRIEAACEAGSGGDDSRPCGFDVAQSREHETSGTGRLPSHCRGVGASRGMGKGGADDAALHGRRAGWRGVETSGGMGGPAPAGGHREAYGKRLRRAGGRLLPESLLHPPREFRGCRLAFFRPRAAVAGCMNFRILPATAS